MVTPAYARPLRVMSLDQCADQYVLALVPEAELALSPRADDPDSWMRDAAFGRARIRPTLEAAVGFQPDVVVRYWGGEPRLLAALERRGARIVTIQDATDLNQVQDVIRTVSEGLEQPGRGQAMIMRMDRRLDGIEPLSRGSALYLTAGGFTAGPGTLIGAILGAAGYPNLATSPGFSAVSVERIALFPPTRFVLGFFDQVRADWRGPGRHPVVRRAAQGRTAARLPAAALSCPAWFAADAAAILADAR
ncbi:ABC transporter substrate-binding protein [Brevundimonas sp.]|uniref:ABC transporter substrate-binding protein n=1 Tax=Brevundimonas sp. TaxID=1871086 RepID=UPI002ABC4C23|nr:ABC transporter substrate-binding protein [Brevundimonas sp.]MDZ4364109.1 ABC transporter substrate-binding protein [Brevundimonas sp.]